MTSHIFLYCRSEILGFDILSGTVFNLIIFSDMFELASFIDIFWEVEAFLEIFKRDSTFSDEIFQCIASFKILYIERSIG